MSRTVPITEYLAIAFALIAAPAGAAAASTSQELSQQCQESAAKYKAEAWPKGAMADSGLHAKFESHYNAKLNRCFVLETVSQVSRSPALKRILPRETQRLLDADDKTEFGKYDSWGDGPPMTCSLQETKCASRQEWLRLVEPFMEE
jgi:hypothetical protein